MSRLIFFLFAGLGLALAATSCRRAAPAAASGPAKVTVAKPIPQRLTEWDEFTGRLSAVASVEVRARVSGYLENTHFVEGRQVKAGELLFTIDRRRYAAEFARAQAELNRAQAALELANAEAERAVQLIRTQAISAEEADVKVKGRLGAAATLAAAQAQLEQAKLDLDWTKVTAPISGRVGRKLITEGNLVTGGPSGATVLTTIVQLDPIYCYFDVDERSALKYRELARTGKRTSALYETIPAQMGLANQEGFPHQGKIDFVDNEISATTGAIKARGVFPNPDLLMSPGFFARVRVPGSGDYEAMLVRDTAIGSDQGRPFVYVVGTDGKAVARTVVVGPLERGLRIVREGLTPADRVVINGLMAVRAGAVVEADEVEMKLPAVAGATR
ncbi:MAG: efflux RND transporter periplasmic adaptor subunit [Opitutaceae bacterium]|nr:efflux RND transporter periplasmic adaptor subunit [Opitutaceae bacterium]